MILCIYLLCVDIIDIPFLLPAQTTADCHTMNYSGKRILGNLQVCGGACSTVTLSVNVIIMSKIVARQLQLWSEFYTHSSCT